MSAAARSAAIACARCGRPAAVITLTPARPGAAEPWADRDRLERAGFLGQVTRFGPWADLQAEYEALAAGQWAAARGADADFVAFVCRTCGRPYCQACWSPPRLEFDDGFYDCSYADCPEGHTQIIDD